MADDDERLIVALEARIRDYERNLQKASATTERQFNQMRRASQNATRQMESDMNRATARINQALAATSSKMGLLAKSYAGAFAAGISARGAQQLLDTNTRIQNALKISGLEGDALQKVYERLYQSAQRNAAPLETLVQLYGRASLVQKELKVSQEELLNFTDKVALALRVAGTDAQSASGALLQLSQALGGGVIRAEEFNSMLEGALPIVQAAAAGLTEAGGSVAKLRALVVDGKVSSEAFFRAFEAGSAILEEKVAGAEMTLSQGFVRLMNVLVDTAGEFDSSAGASKRLGTALQDLSNWIDQTDFSPIISGLIDFGREVVNVSGEINDLMRRTGQYLGTDQFGKWVKRKYGERTEQDAIQNRIEGAFAGTVATKGDKPKGEPMELTVDRGRKAVTLADYPIVGEKKGKGGSKAKKARVDDYERSSAEIEKRTAALVAETEAQRQLNPLMNDFGFTIEKARVQHELLTAAQEEGKQITPQLKAEIMALSEQYAAAAAEANQLAEAQNKALDDMEFRKGVMKGVLTDLRGALEDGKITFQELGDIAISVLDKIIGKIEDELLDAMFKVGNSGGSGDSGGGGGFLGSLISGIGGLFGKGSVNLPMSAPIPTPRPYATGTSYHPGGLAEVNEYGRGEIIDLPRGSRVIPHDISKRMADGAGSAESKPQRLDVYVHEGPMFRTTIERTSQDTAVSVVRENNEARENVYQNGDPRR